MRRRRLLTRAAPLIAVAVIAFAIGIFMALRPGGEERRLVTQYVTAWERTDFPRMYGLLDAASRRHTSESAFAAELQRAADTATVVSMSVLHVGSRKGATIPVRMVIRTKLWQTLRETLQVPLSGSGSSARVHFAGTLVFPGLRAGERLTRRIIMPGRAALLASNGTPLAEGPGRSSPIPDVAGEIVGTLGPIPSDQTAAYTALGYPLGTQVGLDGLERVFQDRLAGTLGGRLLAGRRVLASARPAQAPAITTTIDPPIERAATAAIAGRYAGIAVMNPRTGALLALAGVAFSALQPPGSTMKIVTATGALQAGIVKLGTQFPVQSSASIEGFSLSNAGGESCGGTFLNAFAVSCNSVFAPLGARLGARRLGEHDPEREHDRRFARRSLLGDRSGKGPDECSGNDRRGRDDRDGWPASDPDAPGTSARALRPRHEPAGGEASAKDDDRGGPVRDRNPGADPRGDGRRQDGHC
jgi:peptidoglycan glycosyltransferase